MTITDELTEQVAWRICQLHGLDPDRVYNEHLKAPSWCYYTDEAINAIAAHIALAEIMPPNRATLLAVADAARDVASTEGSLGKMHDLHGDSARAPIHFAALDAWLAFAAALRAKAGDAALDGHEGWGWEDVLRALGDAK